MTELYGEADAFGGEYSRWGYEMTMKLREDTPEKCLWAMNMLSNIARYTYKSGNYYDPEECVPGNGTSLHVGTDSLITVISRN
jgi:hypothetical protein